MNSRALMGLAVVFFLGAFALAWLGIQLSGDDAAPETAVVEADQTLPDDGASAEAAEAGVPVVFARRGLEPGQLVSADDLHTERLRERPPLAFADGDRVAGLMVEAPVRAGEMLLESHFARASQLTRGLEPGEQAVAISVDDVVGAGGWLAPGDRVDVLLYLDDGAARGGDASAQRVHADLRVLAYGPDLAIPGDGVIDPRDDDRFRHGQRGALTAVLAVPEDQATRLMLADNAGRLRLAARAAAERRPDFDREAPGAGAALPEPEAIGGAELSDPPDAAARGRVSLETLRPRRGAAPAAQDDEPRPPPVFLHRGTERETVWPARN